ncbi:hypothetical protein BMJ22_21140 [Sinorhizobium medicae]|nr:hypothetical protein BMJ22_21140 [Sinorhizobium medicae]
MGARRSQSERCLAPIIVHGRLDRGGMVGKTKRVTKDGVADAVNPFCGYIVVEAQSIEAAAQLFQDHPHITVFPGDGVDIMPFVT